MFHHVSTASTLHILASLHTISYQSGSLLIAPLVLPALVSSFTSFFQLGPLRQKPGVSWNASGVKSKVDSAGGFSEKADPSAD